MTVAPPGPVCWPGPAALLQTTTGTRAAGSGPQDLTADQDQDTVSSVVMILTINTDLVLPPSLSSLSAGDSSRVSALEDGRPHSC